jgi:outer membrane protein
MKTLISRVIVLAALSTSSSALWADTLSDIYELALKNDATLKAAEATYRANIETENQGLSSLLPQITATASHSEFDRDTEGFNSNTLQSTLSNRDTETDGWSATLNQTLFDLSKWYTFKGGKESTKEAKAQLAADQQSLIVRVAEAYFDVLAEVENLKASKAESRANKRQLEQTQQRFDVGLIAITDVHEARAAYDLSVVQVLTDIGNLGTAYEALTVLTGQTHDNLWLLNSDYPVINPEPMARDEWVQFALENNFSLKAAGYGSEIALQNAKSKKMDHAPTLDASITYSDNDTTGNTTNLLNGNVTALDSITDGTNWSINLNVPIYSGGQVSSRRRQAYEQYNATFQNEINTRRTVIQDTRSLHLTVVTDVQRVKAREKAIISTQSAVDANQAGYEVGTRNVVDVLQAQRALFASIRDHATTRFNYVVNILKLKEQAGTLSPQDIVDLNKWLVAAKAPTANDNNAIN